MLVRELGSWTRKEVRSQRVGFTGRSLRNERLFCIHINKVTFWAFISSLYETNDGYAHLLICARTFVNNIKHRKLVPNKRNTNTTRISGLNHVLLTFVHCHSTTFCSLSISNVLLYINNYEILDYILYYELDLFFNSCTI